MYFIFHIYQVAKQVGEVLVKQVKKSTGKDMNLAFVSPANAKVAFNLLSQLSIKICKILILFFSPTAEFHVIDILLQLAKPTERNKQGSLSSNLPKPDHSSITF